jgi:hydrogenase maturation protein HypF
LEVERWRIKVQGVVQGVGFRPLAWRVAHEFACSGWILNDRGGVTIEIQGTNEQLCRFSERLKSSVLPPAMIVNFEWRAIAPVLGETGFEILISQDSDDLSAIVTADISPCCDCLEEMRDPLNRRYDYPFINCCHCGPRYTIQRTLPYDRANTTMCTFPMCRDCLVEYTSPDNRRFHAEPIACPACGPSIWYQETGHDSLDCQHDLLTTIERARRDIAAGKIVAIKGVGGFHLACDAFNPAAIAELRLRKQRPSKPLAVMVADLQTAKMIGQLSPVDTEQLNSFQRPIVLIEKIQGLLPEEIAPGNPLLGVMLPYSPLHQLLLASGDVWVMTSGNLADEPIAFDNDEALQRLSCIADAFLLHDRPIHNVCDDSVIRHVGGPGFEEAILLRRSRGFAPYCLDLAKAKSDDSFGARPNDCIFAVGGEIKAAPCLAIGGKAILGPHLGDVGNRLTLEALEHSLQHLLQCYNATPEAIACDLHPGYLSASWAATISKKFGVPLVKVQHHHAHAASLIAEHRLPIDQELLVCVFDGTGYGTDGAIWGGEFLLASGNGFRRAASLSYMPLPGGDQCILKPAKTALAYLHAAQEPWLEQLVCLSTFSERDLRNLKLQLASGVATVQCSSMGRLFDAVAGILGLRDVIEYEGQAAIELEFLAAEQLEVNEPIQPYRVELIEDSIPRWNVALLVSEIYHDCMEGKSKAKIALRFHKTLARATGIICERIWKDSAIGSAFTSRKVVGLTGGVFQNGLLVRMAKQELEKLEFEVLLHRNVPPNDGGLALGQALVSWCLPSRKQTDF